MRIAADFHLHSRYSRATSSRLDLDLLAQWAVYKGIGLLGTGDATHPLWLAEIKQKLKPEAQGIYEYKGVRFVLTAEVNNMFLVAGKTKRIHNLVFFPSIEAAEKTVVALSRYGDLYSDGRPTLRLSAQEMVRLLLNISSEILIVPAHAWTPHFSIFGANSGFDTVEECFGPETKEIFCLETGLSSDPAMNRRLSRLDRYMLISNSDSHSASRIGREANVFELERCDYPELMEILKGGERSKFLYTIEFFPEEGKYHFDGHRDCKARVSPEESQANGGRCPVCGRKSTIGVMHRVLKLADRPDGYKSAVDIPFKRLVPLDQIIAQVRGVGVASKKVEEEYRQIVTKVGTEFSILVDFPEERLRKELPPKIVEGILRVRNEEIKILPGYDGEYGQVHIFGEASRAQEGSPEKQMTLF